MWWSLLPWAVLSAADFPPPDKLPPHAGLPDPLTTLAGDKVATREQWFDKRRPELKELFQHYMYGRFPDPVKIKVDEGKTRVFGGKATLREVAITLGPPEAPKLYLLVVVPANKKGPAPCFVGPNFCGNHAVTDDPDVRVPPSWMYPNYPGVKGNKATEAGRGKQSDVWSIEQSIDRGYAVATFYTGDLDPDRPEERGGIYPFLFPNSEKAAADRASTITVWAWGLMRAVDYLAASPDVDAKKLIAVGHSRLGKTVLLAAAFDDRIAMTIPHQAGCGGTAPSRGKVGESVKQINDRFPHWFDGYFKQFNDDPSKLPFDQNCLVALVAPRPVLFSNAVEDTWANPDGQFEVLKAAEPVYKLLGAGGVGADKSPEVNKLLDGTLGYFIRPGKHSMAREDWKAFLDFADKHLGKPGA